MAKGIHKLTKKQITSLKKEGRYNDGGGLYLHVRKSGSKSWIYRYKSNGRLREVGLGSVNAQNDIIHARKKASEYKVSHSNGKDPLLEKYKKDESLEKRLQLSLKFSEVVEEFLRLKKKLVFSRLKEHVIVGIIVFTIMQRNCIPSIFLKSRQKTCLRYLSLCGYLKQRLLVVQDYILKQYCLGLKPWSTEKVKTQPLGVEI